MTKHCWSLSVVTLLLATGCSPAPGPSSPTPVRPTVTDAPAEEAEPAAPAQPTAEEPAAEMSETGTTTDIEVDEKYRPALYVDLPEYCPTPDGMTLDDATGIIYLNCPNFNSMDENKKKEFPSVLMAIDKDGKATKIYDYEPHPETGQCGPMGMDIGPDGNLYVADNQYFHDTDHKSRMLRLTMKEGKPEKTEVIVDGLKLANAVVWKGDYLYVTDTFLDLEGRFGASGLWRFHKDELQGPEPLKVKPNGEDEHLVLQFDTKKIGREETAGADGCTVDSEGNMYVGNFGDGVITKISFDDQGEISGTQKIVDREDFQCCDGIFYDKATDTIYINDSQANAIRTLKPDGTFGTLWINGDTDGSDGLLDQPAECLVRGGKLIIVNFDMPFPGLINSAFDKPYTVSVINLTD